MAVIDVTNSLDSAQSELWSCIEDDDHLCADSPFEALRNYLYDADPKRLPELITVYGFKRRVVMPRDCGHPLEQVLETLDDEFANEKATKPTEAMLAAEAVFVAAIVAEYDVWACDCIEICRINWREWCHEHDPDLLVGYS